MAAPKLGNNPDTAELCSSSPTGLSVRAVPASFAMRPAKSFTWGLTWSASTAAVARALMPAGRKLPCPGPLPGAAGSPNPGS